ncbi:MAG: hypothetical protein AB1546_13605 [bacterium]
MEKREKFGYQPQGTKEVGNNPPKGGSNVKQPESGDKTKNNQK